jgi:hypothetical protein
LNIFVETFKKFLKRVSKDLQWNSVQFDRQVFLSVFNILKPLSFEGNFHRKKEKKNPLMRDQENRMGGLSPEHSVWPDISSVPLRMGGGVVMQREPTALCSKLWPRLGNVLQQSSDNLNVENTTDCLPFRHKFYMNHTLFVKNVTRMILILDFCKRKFWALVMTFGSTAY